MTTLRTEFNQSDDPTFEEDPPLAAEPPAPLDEMQQQLRDLENAILATAATTWSHRIAIARATGNEKDYRAACALDGIDPGF
jgi:hypothetical protein